MVLGWGVLFWKSASFCIGIPSRVPLWGEIGFYGLFALGIIATLLNFFSPINLPILILMAISGVALFYRLVLQNPDTRKTLTKSFVFLSLTISFFLTLFAGYNSFSYDAGLYHLPYQLWMRKEPVVLGLANLHSRLGFNSILDAISSIFWLPNQNFLLVSFVESFFFFFFYLTLLEFLLRGRSSSRTLSVNFALLSPLSFLMFDDYFFYLLTSTDTPAALTALLSVFSFLRAADKRRSGKNIDAEILSLHIFAAFAIAIKLSMVPILIIVASSYFVFLGAPLIKWHYFLRVALLSALTFLPIVLRNLAVSGCFFYPIALSCVSEFPWSAEQNAISAAQTITRYARSPGDWRLADQWDWILPWLERNLELLVLLMATTFVISVWGYLQSTLSVQRKSPHEGKQVENQRLSVSIPILLVFFEGVALTFWFFLAPDKRFGILPLHLFTLLPALMAVSKVGGMPPPTASRSFLYTMLGILLIVSCILQISEPHDKRFSHISLLFKSSLHAPVVETEPVPQYGVRPINPDVYNCWIVEEPCSPEGIKGKAFDVGRIGPFKAFLRK